MATSQLLCSAFWRPGSREVLHCVLRAVLLQRLCGKGLRAADMICDLQRHPPACRGAPFKAAVHLSAQVPGEVLRSAPARCDAGMLMWLHLICRPKVASDGLCTWKVTSATAYL